MRDPRGKLPKKCDVPGCGHLLHLRWKCEACGADGYDCPGVERREGDEGAIPCNVCEERDKHCTKCGGTHWMLDPKAIKPKGALP